MSLIMLAPEITDISESSEDIYVELPDNQRYGTFPTRNMLTNESQMEIPMLDLELINAHISPRKKRFKESKLPDRLSKLKDLNQEDQRKNSTKSVMKTLLTKTMVRNVVQKLKRNKFYRDFSKLSIFHFNLINDLSAFFNQERNGCKNFQQRESRFSILLWRFSKFASKLFGKFLAVLPIFSPLTWQKIIWDLLLSILFATQLFLLTFEVAFFIEFEQREFYIFLNIIFYIDLLISMNTKIFKNGVQITKRRLILRSLVNKKFFSDIMPAILYTFINIFYMEKNLRYLNLILLLKYGKAKKNLVQIKELIIKNEGALIFFKLFKLLVKIFIFGHLIACFWHFVGYESNQRNPEGSNWLKNKGIVDENWRVKYLYSIYWSVTTMLSVGYGDITASNEAETVFNIFAMFIGCCVFGYSVSIITAIFKQANRKAAILDERMSKISFMLRDKKLPLETQAKVKKYLGFIWKQEQHEDPEYETLIMNKLSSNLRDEIYLNTIVKYLESVPCFNSFSNRTLLCLARVMKKERVSPEEHVYREGDTENLGIYFVVDGELHMATERESMRTKVYTKWKTYRKKEFFGENETFTGASRNYSVISGKFSTLFFLKRSDLIYILRKIPKDYEKFCQIRDMEIIYNDENAYGVKCDSCGYNDHKIKYCPFLRYMPDKTKVIERLLKKRKRKAKNFKRRNLVTDNALLEKNRHNKMVSEFLSVYTEDGDLEYLFELYSSSEPKYSALEEKSDDRQLFYQRSKPNSEGDSQEYCISLPYQDFSSTTTSIQKQNQMRKAKNLVREMVKKKAYLRKNSPLKDIKYLGANLEKPSLRKKTFLRQNHSPQSPRNAPLMTPRNLSNELRIESHMAHEMDGGYPQDLEYFLGIQKGLELEEIKMYDNLDPNDLLGEGERTFKSKSDFDRVKSFENYFPGTNIENFLFKFSTTSI